MKLKVCKSCSGKIENKLINYILLDKNLGKFKAEVCTKCGEQVFGEEVFDEIEKKAKELGFWGCEL